MVAIEATIAKILRERDYCFVFATMGNTSKAGTPAGLSNVEILELDVASEDSIVRCTTQAKERTGDSLDILVNNAGRGILMPLLDTDIKGGKTFFEVNFWSVLAVTYIVAIHALHPLQVCSLCFSLELKVTLQASVNTPNF
ncbi:hypothetical protein F4824DRAFT_517020 [Ustulina deusta]|nr:hypothetical protein F4824DRAFT_517020 [Ustulina deusta]